MIIGIDHGYYAIKTRHCSFPAGLTCYGSHEPYTRQNVLEVDGQFYVYGTGRQPVRRDKTENEESSAPDDEPNDEADLVECTENSEASESAESTKASEEAPLTEDTAPCADTDA